MTKIPVVTLRFITARKRSLRSLCFYTCLSVSHSVQGGLHPGGGRQGLHPGGSASRGREGGLHSRGSASRGVCIHGGGIHLGGSTSRSRPTHRILRDTVSERAVRILLECILVMEFNFVSPIMWSTLSWPPRASSAFASLSSLLLAEAHCPRCWYLWNTEMQ